MEGGQLAGDVGAAFIGRSEVVNYRIGVGNLLGRRTRKRDERLVGSGARFRHASIVQHPTRPHTFGAVTAVRKDGHHGRVFG
jgi:hypothetical protein